MTSSASTHTWSRLSNDTSGPVSTDFHCSAECFESLSSKHEALGRRKIERGPLRTCRVHRRQLHRGYPMRRKYPKAMLCALSFSVLRASWFLLRKLRKTFE